MPRLATLCCLLSFALLCVVGCSADSKEAVDVAPPHADQFARAPCERLVDGLPARVDDLAPRGISPARALARAWGSPPIVLRCGVGPPRGFGPASQCITVNDVDWYADKRRDRYVFTTVGRTVAVELTVPHDYRPEVNALVDVAQAIKANTRAITPCV
jgi:hypothetical protein